MIILAHATTAAAAIIILDKGTRRKSGELPASGYCSGQLQGSQARERPHLHPLGAILEASARILCSCDLNMNQALFKNS